LSFWYELDRSGAEISATAAGDYAERLSTASGFGVGGEMLYSSLEHAFHAGDRLRGLMFEAALVDHFRSAHGRRWWASRKASDELRDIWNTASRYSVEELSRMLGLGELDPDPLADRLTRLIGPS
jgi:hypothetical protein